MHPDHGLENSIYLQRYAHPVEFLAREEVSPGLGMVVAIPCYNEPGLIATLNSLHQCERPDCDVEVIVLINEPENVSAEVHRMNEKCFREAYQWVRWHQSPSMKYYVLWIKNLPEKWSGVGFARKIAMDEAVRRFRKADNPEGIILGFDADSTCQDNFLVTVKNEFTRYRLNGASIYFEHSLQGEEDSRIYEGIIRYELHLRYFIMAQKYAGFPYAFHAIGSSMAVKNDVYEKQGGMNRRKAGEDFYFLHKIIPLGHYMEIAGTTVYPSPRESDRVPFGTGKAMTDWMKKKDMTYLTYHPGIFESLKRLFDTVDDLFDAAGHSGDPHQVLMELHPALQEFLSGENFAKSLAEFRETSTRKIHFRDKFFRWFNGLKLLQYVHYAQSDQFTPVPLEEAVGWLQKQFQLKPESLSDLRQALLAIRKHDRDTPMFYQRPEG